MITIEDDDNDDDVDNDENGDVDDDNNTNNLNTDYNTRNDYNNIKRNNTTISNYSSDNKNPNSKLWYYFKTYSNTMIKVLNISKNNCLHIFMDFLQI